VERSWKMVSLALAAIILIGMPAVTLADDGWIELSRGSNPLAGWRNPTGDWFTASSVRIDPKNPQRLRAKPGEGILVNGLDGDTTNLLTRRDFQDVEVHLEFLIPHRSNSGVKLEGLYEVQIFDSYGVQNPAGTDCGGIYPRAERKPVYHHIDRGFPPLVNAARPAGEWQTFDIIFQAPRFDARHHKTRNARFVKVLLNGKLVHENVEMRWPTGHAWREPEAAAGPLLLQADHGPVAFRNVRVRAYEEPRTK